MFQSSAAMFLGLAVFWEFYREADSSVSVTESQSSGENERKGVVQNLFTKIFFDIFVHITKKDKVPD